MRYLPLAIAVSMVPWVSQACTLKFTSPGDGATVRSAAITVYGVGGADATEGDFGTVTATLNGASFFNYSGSFTAAVSFLQSRGVGVTLRPGQNFLFVSGSVGGCSATDTMTITYDPEVTQAKNKGAPPPESCHGNPINTAIGNKYQIESDYQSTTSPGLRFERSYNSFDGFWRHNYSARLVLAASSIRLIHADGREVEFARAGSTAIPAVDELGSLTESSGTWTYKSPDQETLQFDSQGRIISLQNFAGRSLTFTYADRTVTVASDTEQALSFTQDDRYQPLTLSAPGVSVQYNYDVQKRLISLSKSYGSTIVSRSFLYENMTYPRFLTGIVDEKGVRFASWSYDSAGRATSSSHGDGVENITVDYNADGSSTVTNEFGKKTTYRYQVIQGVKKVVAIEGEPSANCPASNSTYTYNTRGLLVSKTNNKGHVTTYNYNERGLEISRIDAFGTPQARTITTTWHPTLFLPATIAEPNRTTTYTYDDKGRPLSQSVSQR
ncbi:DUF6531 domain-containing protein [Cystobacter fuscus]|uniref:DUF6531 domain-containing protein n=1 Tax=Cystobacter fuscus TaxID=43 RepID=UPI001B7FC904|nr:DUF6531 domain-containing protein [Cystobacter fuscus]